MLLNSGSKGWANRDSGLSRTTTGRSEFFTVLNCQIDVEVGVAIA